MINITTRTTVVSNVQLDDNIRIWLLEEEGFKSAPETRKCRRRQLVVVVVVVVAIVVVNIALTILGIQITRGRQPVSVIVHLCIASFH